MANAAQAAQDNAPGASNCARGRPTLRELVCTVLERATRALSGREISAQLLARLGRNPESYRDQRYVQRTVGVTLTRFRNKPIDATRRLTPVPRPVLPPSDDDGAGRGMGYRLEALRPGEQPYPPSRRRHAGCRTRPPRVVPPD